MIRLFVLFLLAAFAVEPALAQTAAVEPGIGDAVARAFGETAGSDGEPLSRDGNEIDTVSTPLGAAPRTFSRLRKSRCCNT